MGSIAPSGLHKHFCVILGSRDMSKTIWGISFQGFEIISNLISWNLIPQRFMHNFSLIFGGLDISHFKGDFLWYVSGSNAFLYNIREPKYKQNIMRHQISRHEIVQYLHFLNSDIPFWFSYFSASWCHTEIFLYTRWSYGSHLSKEICPRRPFFFVAKDIIQTILGAFFLGHPVFLF